MALLVERALSSERRMMYCILALIVLFTIGKNFSTTSFYITQDLFKHDVGISDQSLSLLFACGYMSSFPAKLIAGHLADANGSAALILFCMAGFFVGTLLFSFVPSGTWAIYLAIPIWSFTTFFSQGVFRVVSRTMAADWIPSSHLGRLMSLVTLAPNLGDVIVRLTLAPLLSLGWSSVLRISTLLILLTCLPFAMVAWRTQEPEKASDLETPLAKDLDAAVQKVTANKKSKKSLSKMLQLLKNPDIYVLCCLSCLMFATRTLFLVDSTNLLGQIRCAPFQTTTSQPDFAYYPSDDTDQYMMAVRTTSPSHPKETRQNVVGTTFLPASGVESEMDGCLHSHSTLQAITTSSSIYTLVGAMSTMVVGTVKDMAPKKHRAVCLVPFVAVLFVLSLMQVQFGASMGFEWTVARLALTGFCLFGPYKIISVFAVDIGGRELKGTVTGLVGASESAGAVLILLIKGWAGDDWMLMFAILSIMSFVCLMLSIKLWIRDLFGSAERAPWIDINSPQLPK